MEIIPGQAFPFNCPSCKETIYPDQSHIKKYLSNESICSSGCQLDLFSQLTTIIHDMSSMGAFYSLIGAHIKVSKKPLKQGCNVIPAPKEPDEKLLWVNYTRISDSKGEKPFIAESRGNVPKSFKYNSEKINLIATHDTTVTVAGWSLKQTEDSIWHQLMIEASDMFTFGQYSLLAVAANAACENLTTKFFKEILSHAGIGNDKIKDFIKNSATYGHQLNVFIPAFCRPKLPQPIYDALNDLKRARNEIAHGNVIIEKKPIEYAKWLVAAVMLRVYFTICKFEAP